MPTSLLPPNSTPLERALEAGARPQPLATPAAAIDDPATCPADLLPWLAWGLSVDGWDPAWSEARKREAVAGSLALHRIKGTRQSVDRVLARIDDLARVIEWHDDPARLAPHVFEVDLPLVVTAGAAGGSRAGAGIVDDIIAAVGRVKPLREHLVVVQSLAMAGGVGIQAVAGLAGYHRDDALLIDDRSLDWDALLQTEQGEPLQAENGALLDTAS